MKKILILSTIMLCMSTVGCTSKDINVEEFTGDDTQYAALVHEPEAVEDSNKNDVYNENFKEEKDSSVVFAMYDGLDENKYKLTYDYAPQNGYLYEGKDGFALNSALKDEPSINDKKYKSILTSFTFPGLVMSARITYSEAMKLVEKVLPDDIVKEEEKIKMDNCELYIYYSSQLGNFVVNLSRESSSDASFKDDDTIYGISYYKELKEY